MTTTRTLPPLPDLRRFGGPGWLATTGGKLDARQCVCGAGVAARQQVKNLWERLTAAFRTPTNVDAMPAVPGSRIVALAEGAALEQNVELLAHGFRTALFARALAHIDDIHVEPDLRHVCGLLHDVGIMQAVTGEDFTLRSAVVACRCAAEAGEADLVGEHLADALIVHATVGVSAAKDGALGAYTQSGAMVDLVGLRLSWLTKAFVTATLAAHPRGAFKRESLRRLTAEAAAVRGGRFEFAQRVGVGVAVRWSPFTK